MLKYFLALLLMITTPTAVLAQVEFDIDRNSTTQPLRGTGFPNYRPFGYPSDDRETNYFGSIFNFILADYAKQANFSIRYETQKNYPQTLRELRGGQFDFILGAYSASKDYAGIELIYPALINNPVVVITPLYSTVKISSVADLKNLKGGMGSYEYFSDYVNQQIAELNIEKIDNPYELYKKLFSKEFDYVLASEYNARILLSEIGLRSQISMSSPVWSIPVFIGISKVSRYRNKLKRGLTKISSDPATREKLISVLQDYINKIEEKNIGIVAPDFINDK